MARLALVTIRNQLAFGPRTLHRLAEHAGHSVESLFVGDHFLDPRPVTEAQIRIVAEWVREVDPDVFGVSLTSYAYRDAIEITRAVREVLPDVITVWGGHHPTIAAEDCVDHAHLVCRGEGEGPLLDLLDGVDAEWAPDRLRSIPNMASRGPDGPRLEPIRPAPQDLDTLPTPDFSNYNKYYLYGEQVCVVDKPYDDTQIYYTMTSRGCPYSCSFCCISFVRSMYKDSAGKFLRRRSVEHVITELEEARRNYPSLSFIYFFDDVFVFNLAWLKEFSREYRRRIGLPFWCYGYVNTTREPMLETLVEAGLHSISMGIQSGSEQVRRKIYDRPETDKAVLRAAQMVKRFGIDITWDLICGPFESEADKESAFELFFQLPKPYRFHFHPLSYYRNLGVTRRAQALGIISDEQIVGELKQLTQSITDFETFESTPIVVDDPHYRLLKLFGRRHVPDAAIRMLRHASKRTVLNLFRLHDRLAPRQWRFFERTEQPQLRGTLAGKAQVPQ